MIEYQAVSLFRFLLQKTMILSENDETEVRGISSMKK